MKLTRRGKIVLSAAAALTAFTVGLSWPMPATDPMSALPACPSDDGAPYACAWHAERDGDGHGVSFWVDAQGVVHYVSEGRAS